MAITLDPTLAEAQDSMVRQPIVKLLATQVLESMPFDGSVFNNIDDTEHYTDLVTSEDGHIIGAYINGTNIVLVHTDLSKVAWETTSTRYWSGRSMLGISIEEIEVGTLGVLFIDGTRLMSSNMDEITGEFLSGPSVVEDFSPEYITCVTVRKLLDDSFMCAYVVLNTTLDTYEIRTRTSADFITWSASSVVSIPELISGRPVDNVSLLAMSSGDIMLFFDYATLEKEDGTLAVTNVYMITSHDGGLTWVDLEQVTNYTTYGTSALDPSADEKADGSIALAYTDSKRVLFASNDTLLWDNNDCGVWNNYNASNIHFDPVTRRCYVYQLRSYVGVKAMCGVIVIDVDAWEVVEVYNAHTTPGYTNYFENTHVWIGKDKGAGEFAVFSGDNVAVLINDKEKTIKQYIINNYDGYELVGNIEKSILELWYMTSNGTFTRTYMDAEERKFYCLIEADNPWSSAYQLGYFDADEDPDPATGMYTFNIVSEGKNVINRITNGGMILVRERNIMVIEGKSSLAGHAQYPGYLYVFDMTSGGLIKEYSRAEYNLFPAGGVYNTVYYDGCIYGSFPYVTFDDQDIHRGMVKINLDTDEITYHAPTYTTANDYGLGQKVATSDGRILIAVSGGVAEFNTVSGAWHLYGNTTVPGFDPNGLPSRCTAVAYDELEKNILVGSISTITTSAFTGLRMFNETGSYNIGQYVMATLTDGWDWGEVEDLTTGHEATDNALTIDTENVAWSIWTDGSGDSLTTMWDKDVKEMEVQDLLIAGKDVSITRSVENTGQLSFTLSHGHLFDQNNTLSTWSNFLKKGKLIDAAFGENIDGIEYFQQQGLFTVDSVKLTYKRGTYPEITVNCVQPDIIWSNIRVEATPRYDSTNPEELLRDLIMSHALFEADMIDITTFPNRHDIHHQWIDIDLKSLVMEFLGHFQSIPYFDENGVFTTKILSPNKDTEHVYTGLELIDFTPDENYSSFTNSITVTGEGLYTVEVTYPEELIDTIFGTAGWWEGGNREITVNYSNTRDLVCYDPRMYIKQSIHDFKIFDDLYKHNIEEITYIDPLNRYCIVTVELPGLMLVLVGLLTTVLFLAKAANSCTVNCGPFIYGITVIQIAIAYIVGQVVSYEYEIYAKPTGEEKQLLSFTVEDLPFQQELGGIVASEVYDDPYCYTVQSCREVANYEMSIVKAQRRRVSFSKLAHLQDEVLDKIRINHPYSGIPIDVIITDLTRVYNRPPPGSSTGSFRDNITGWIV